jgi:hypothetical protein
VYYIVISFAGLFLFTSLRQPPWPRVWLDQSSQNSGSTTAAQKRVRILGVAGVGKTERTLHTRRTKQTNNAIHPDCGGHDVCLFGRIGEQVESWVASTCSNSNSPSKEGNKHDC